jgi:ubiquinone/menaquinone biosynthesis C-methylase UbiE
VDALDSTMAMIQMVRGDAARHRVQDRIRTYAADVHALPFRAHTFDLVIAIGVIPWLHSERVALREMRRVLKHDGYLLVTADNNARLNRMLDPLSSPVSAPFRLVAKRILRLCGLWSPTSGFQPKRHYPREFSRSIGDCGFEHVKTRTVGFGPFTFLGKAILTDASGIRLHRWLQTAASRHGSFPLRWAGAHYLVLATRA